MKYIAIHGRQPELGVAELEALLGPGKLSPISRHASFVDEQPDFARLGSTVKWLQFLESIRFVSLSHCLDAALPFIIDAHKKRGGKLQLGVSSYGRRVTPSQLNRAALQLKKKLRSKGLSVRLVPNKQQELNAAQVLRNKLDKGGFELCLVFEGKTAHMGRTQHVQDIDEYTRRDRDKPVRDPLVGMLPPKLAQTLINLTNPSPKATLLDPFCGTGTVLMEAHAMGLNSHGSDISPEMVDATAVNMQWFVGGKKHPTYSVELADATMHQWQTPIDVVVGETYLGPPLRHLPDSHKHLMQLIDEVDDIHRRFLQNLSPQLPSGTRLALAVPAWYQKQHFLHLPVLDDLEKLGYNRASFVHLLADSHQQEVGQDIIYHRPQQVVGRRILNLIRK